MDLSGLASLASALNARGPEKRFRSSKNGSSSYLQNVCKYCWSLTKIVWQNQTYKIWCQRYNGILRDSIAAAKGMSVIPSNCLLQRMSATGHILMMKAWSNLLPMKLQLDQEAQLAQNTLCRCILSGWNLGRQYRTSIVISERLDSNIFSLNQLVQIISDLIWNKKDAWRRKWKSYCTQMGSRRLKLRRSFSTAER